jgi:hypothetical protein
MTTLQNLSFLSSKAHRIVQKQKQKKFPKYKQPFVAIHLPSFSQETHSSRVVHRTLKQQEVAEKEK